MATLTPDPTGVGKELFDGTSSFRAKNDIGDNKVAGVYSHREEEASATEANEWISYFMYLRSVLSDGGSAVKIYNATGGTLAAGTAVYISGYNGSASRMTIAKADATDASKYPVGFVTEALTDTTAGVIQNGAVVTGLDTSAAAGVGSLVYLDTSTPGTWTLSAPSLPNRTIVIGYVTVKNASTGAILFRADKRAINLLADIQNMDFTGLADGHTLKYVDSTKKWTSYASVDTDEKVKASSGDATPGYLDAKVDNSTIEVSGTSLRVKALGIADSHVNTSAAIAWSKISKSGAAAGDVGAAATSHTHAASDINSGTLDRARLPGVTLVSMSGDQTPATTDKNKTYANLGATLRTITLPAAAEGEGPFWAYVGHSDGVRFAAQAGDRLRVGANVTTADTGHVDSTTVGSAIEFIAIDSTNWVARTVTGTWSVTAS